MSSQMAGKHVRALEERLGVKCYAQQKSTQRLNFLTRKTIKFAIAFLCIAMLGTLAFRINVQKNPDVPKIEAYIRASHLVHSRVGTVEKISVRGLTSVAPSTTSAGYTVYKIYIQGTAGSDFLKIYMTHTSETSVLMENPLHCCGLD
jgi:hypothetical protein